AGSVVPDSWVYRASPSPPPAHRSQDCVLYHTASTIRRCAQASDTKLSRMLDSRGDSPVILHVVTDQLPGVACIAPATTQKPAAEQSRWAGRRPRRFGVVVHRLARLSYKTGAGDPGLPTTRRRNCGCNGPAGAPIVSVGRAARPNLLAEGHI